MNSKLKQSYWEYLLRNTKPREDEKIEQKLRKAVKQKQNEFEKLNTDSQVIESGTVITGNPIDDISRRGAAVIRLASLEIESDVENKLNPFGKFMEPNPRFMKRVINCYGIARSIEIMSTEQEYLGDFGKWIRWIILCLRWPYLVECLHANPKVILHFYPEHAAQLKQKLQGITEEDLKILLLDSSIKEIIIGNPSDPKDLLNENDVRYLSSMIT